MTWQPHKSVVVSTLGITQTLAWGSSYYLTAVFADPVSAGLGLSRAWFFGAVSAALLLSGLLGPLAGRTIDRYGGRDVLAATNLVFALGLGLMAIAVGPVTLALAWVVIGMAMGFGLYEAAFATAAGLYGLQARNAITGITLIAGFASTVGWPLSAALIDAFGWRIAALGWAGLHLVVGLPMNRLLVPKAPVPAHAGTPAVQAAVGVPWTMIILASVFGVTWFVSAAFAAHLPRLLQALGATPTAGGGAICRVWRLAAGFADAVGAAGDDAASDRRGAFDRRGAGSGGAIRAAARGRKRVVDDCSGDPAVGAVWGRRVRAADGAFGGTGADPARRGPAGFWRGAGSGWPAVGVGAVWRVDCGMLCRADGAATQGAVGRLRSYPSTRSSRWTISSRPRQPRIVSISSDRRPAICSASVLA